MSSGLFAVSMLLAALLLVFIDIPLTGQVIVPLVEQSRLVTASGPENQTFSLVFGKIIVYFIFTVAIYLFLRGVHKSFSYSGHGKERTVSRYS